MSDEYAEFQDRLDFIKATVTGYENVPRTLQRPEHRRYVSDVTYLLARINAIDGVQKNQQRQIDFFEGELERLVEEKESLADELRVAYERAEIAEQEAEDWRNSVST